MEEININNINNKKALFIYYSGTNNTLDLVLKISKRLIKEEIISSYSLYFPLAKKKKNIDLKEYSYLFIAYPIYAFNSIKLLEKEIKRIIDFNKDNDLSLLKIIIIKQSGEALRLNNSSSFTLKKYLAKHHSINKNNIKEYHFLYPYNIHFRFKDEHIKELINEVRSYAFFNDLTIAPKIKIVQGTKDQYVSIESFKTYCNILGCESALIPEADHCFSKLSYTEQVVKEMLSFYGKIKLQS